MKYLILLIMLASQTLSIPVMAQETWDPDSMFWEARELILNRKRDEGRSIAYKILEKSPEYSDVLILVGRSHSWDGAYDSASYYFERAIKASPQYEDAYVAYLDNLMWAEQYDEAESVYALAEGNFAVMSSILRYRRSRIHYFQEEYQDALRIAEELFEQDAKIDGLLWYIQNIRRLSRVNAVGATYDYDSFMSQLNPWHTSSIYARTMTKFTGSLIARVTHSSRFDAQGVQYEVDAYPSLGKRSYAYLNVGYSEAFFFPRYRFGGSVYWNLDRAWEIDLGYRHLAFQEVTHIYTASLGKYASNWWLNLRGNYIPSDFGGSVSGIAQARYYFKGAEDFFSLQLSTGVSPDEQSRDLQVQLLNSYRARLGYQQLVTERWMLFGFTGYSHDEFLPGMSRPNFNLSLGTEFRF